MTIEEIQSTLSNKLRNQLITSRVLLDRLRLISEDSRKSSQYQDPKYLPFYYYLSRVLFPKKIVHIGFDLALPSCCFLQGSESAEEILGFQFASEKFYSPRLAFSNIKDIKNKNFFIDYYYGKFNDLEFIKKLQKNFDLFLITERLNNDQINELMDICWEYLNLDGFIVVDHLKSNKSMGDIFRDFCKGKNKPSIEFATRYGAGIIQK